MKKIKLALELSDLVIYTKSEKFVSFENQRANQHCYENNSIGELKARKLVKQSGNFFWFSQIKVIMLPLFIA